MEKPSFGDCAIGPLNPLFGCIWVDFLFSVGSIVTVPTGCFGHPARRYVAFQLIRPNRTKRGPTPATGRRSGPGRRAWKIENGQP